jgi:hypothetical protein
VFLASGPRSGVLGPVSLLGIGDHVGRVPVEPFPAVVDIDRRVRSDLGPVDRHGAEPA